MTPKEKLIFCLTINVITFTAVTVVVTVFAHASQYWRYGPADDLIVISVKVDTWIKYWYLLLGIAVINMCRVLVEELAWPVLGFTIYNPDKHHIADFTKNELQFFANSMSVISGLRNVFMTVITVTQVDIALWSLLVCEITSFYTNRVLLNEKTFKGRQDVKPANYGATWSQ